VKPGSGSAAEKTMLHAIETGKIHRRQLGLSSTLSIFDIDDANKSLIKSWWA
jgi:hypothetical protein